MKFKAAIAYEVDKPLRVEKVEIDKSLDVGQVLVKLDVSGICGAQLLEIKGHKNNAKFMPHMMGHEGSGTVVEIGPGVTTLKPDDNVVAHWMVGEGIEASFPSYKCKGVRIGGGKVTTFAEYAIISENRLTKVNSNANKDLCALLGCGLTTGLGVVNNECSVKFGESLMVIGCGGVGLNLIQGAKMNSCYPIYAVDINDNKKDIAIKLGATYFINLSESKFSNHLQDVDIITDTVGSAELISEAISFLSNEGRYIMVGHLPPNKTLEIPNAVDMFFGKGKLLRATQGGKTCPQEDIPRYIKLAEAGLIDIDPLITHRTSLDNINDALDLIRQSQAGRVLIDL
jgi:S-(hydroxymethyl)glutathione dehydrogenase/alcohol dehydrogenase